MFCSFWFLLTHPRSEKRSIPFSDAHQLKPIVTLWVKLVQDNFQTTARDPADPSPQDKGETFWLGAKAKPKVSAQSPTYIDDLVLW